MKKVICLLIALMLCVSMAAPALAVEGKPSPEFKEITAVPGVLGGSMEFWGMIFDAEDREVTLEEIMNAEGLEDLEYIKHECLEITPIVYLRDESKEVAEDIKDLLNYLYGGLRNETIEVPYEMLGEGMSAANMTEIDFCDIRWSCTEHARVLEPEGVVITLTLDISVGPDVEVFIMVYDKDDNEWEPAVLAVNNGDGTVTCTLEDLGALVFAVKVDAEDVAAVEEANESGSSAAIFAIGAVVVAGGGVALVLKGKKKGAAAAK